MTNEEMYEFIKKNTKEEVHINNRKRMIRILDKYNNNNLDTEKKENELVYDNVFFIGLTTERDKLYEIVDNRVDKMIEKGLIEEAQKLYNKKIHSKAVTTGIGYKELYQYFDGIITLDEAIELIKKNTRHYIKRQYTWFNNKMNIEWFNVDFDNFDNTIKQVSEYIEG